MSNKSKNNRVGICLVVIATCIVLVGLWAVLATPKAALAKKPSDGGDSGVAPVCIEFDIGGGIQSDDGTPYCDDKQLKVEANMTQDGHVNLQPNTGRGQGRTLLVYTNLTGEIPLVGWRFLLGGWRDDFDMRDMYLGEVREDVNLMINAEAPSNSENIVNWLLNLWPDRTRYGIDYSESTFVTVTRDTADTWTIEVDDADRAVLVLHKQVKNKSEFIYGGVVTIPPFTATVTLVP